MVTSIPISLSGLNAAQKRLQASASNIANLRTSEVNPDTSADGKTTAYSTREVIQKSENLQGGVGVGVSATIVEREDGTTLISDPTSPFADMSGLVAMPNISIEEEILNLTTAKIAYKTNAFAIKVAKDTENSLINELA